MQFYVYIYLDPRTPVNLDIGGYHFDFQPLYVGKGSGNRIDEHLQNTKRVSNPIFRAKIEHLRSINPDWPIRRQIAWFDSEQQAYAEEDRLIRLIGSKHIGTIPDGPLCNICLGNSPPNHRGKTYEEIYGDRAAEQRVKRIDTLKNTCWNRNGTIHSDKTKEKMRSMTKRLLSENGHPMKDKKHLQISKEKMSSSHQKKVSRNIIRLLISPSGEYFIVVDLTSFCKKNNISKSTLEKAKKEGWGGIKTGKTKGWVLDRVIQMPKLSNCEIISVRKIKENGGVLFENTPSFITDLFKE